MAIRSSAGLDSPDHVVVQVLPDQVMPIQLMIIAEEALVLLPEKYYKVKEGENRVCKRVLEISSTIIAIISAVLGLVDIDPSNLGFPRTLNKLHPFKLAVKGSFLAVMVCFCFCLGLLMLSEVTKRPPISIAMAGKLMLLVLTLVQLTVALY